MKYQEKKYKIDAFANIKKILDKNHAKKGNEIVTVHYYARIKGNNIVKLVKYTDRNEIHILEESAGTYSLKRNIPMLNTDTGLEWLKDNGYTIIDIVKMAYTDYEYGNGIVGLYVINDFLYSVILDFPEGRHLSMEKEFGLNNAEIITNPYNKYLEKIGRNQTMKLK